MRRFLSDLVEDVLGVTHDREVTHTTLQCSFHSHKKSSVFSYVDRAISAQIVTDFRNLQLLSSRRTFLVTHNIAPTQRLHEFQKSLAYYLQINQVPSLITGWSTSLQGVDGTDQVILGEA